MDDKAIEAAALAIDGEAFDPTNENWRYWSSRRKQAIAKARAAIAAYRDAEIERLTAERDEARANYQFMVERAANEKLDGYRELGERAANAENAQDDLRAKLEVAERDAARYRWLRNTDTDRPWKILQANGGDLLDDIIDLQRGGERG
ncbi:MAG: hypothetical protein K2Y51_00375 [Gammaproteobacteria bacterium]|nr:hypothetical protein [Gammaproteobacteria bacterium]